MEHVKEIDSADTLGAAPSRLQRFSYGWRALRHRNFRLFFAGQSISLIGTWMTRVATSWLIYRLTGSALLLGLVSFAGQIPTFLLAPFAGVLVDRLNRRKMLVWTQTLAAVQSLALAGLTLAKIINVHEVLALSVMQGLINAFDMPGRQSFLIQMVEDKQDLGNAIALNSSMVNIARLIGPALAGIVIGSVGEGYCFLIDGISYLAVIASLLMMRVQVIEAKPSRASMLQQLKEGWTYVIGFPPIRTILSLFALIQPDGHALHGTDAHLRRQSSARRSAYTRVFTRSVGRGRLDLRHIAGIAKNGARADQHDSDFGGAVWRGFDLFWSIAISAAIPLPDAHRRLWHDAGYGREQHGHSNLGSRRQARPGDELLHHGIRGYGAFRQSARRMASPPLRRAPRGHDHRSILRRRIGMVHHAVEIDPQSHASDLYRTGNHSQHPGTSNGRSGRTMIRTKNGEKTVEECDPVEERRFSAA